MDYLVCFKKDVLMSIGYSGTILLSQCWEAIHFYLFKVTEMWLLKIGSIITFTY